MESEAAESGPGSGWEEDVFLLQKAPPGTEGLKAGDEDILKDRLRVEPVSMVL